jgi:HTH-type transcriptional regulator, sugar sensing transcriptional regulator
MSNENLFEKIKKLGFSEYEARCYLALLERKSLNVGEVSRLAGIPKPNAYESLEKLLAKGLCVSIPGKMKQYAAADPWFLKEKTLENLNNSIEIELENIEEKRKEILHRKKLFQEDIENVTNELDSLFKGNQNDGVPFDYIEILREPLQIRHRVIQLANDAKKEILAFTKPPYSFVTKEQQEDQKNPQLDALRRRVKTRTIYELPQDEEDQLKLLEAASELIRLGEDARVIDELPIKLMIFDSKIALFALVDPIIGKPSVTSLVAEHQALAKSFKLLFESFWGKSRDYHIINSRKIPISEFGKKTPKSKK